MLIHVLKHECQTSLPKSRIISIIKMRTSPSVFKNDYEFFGLISENSFKIHKNLNYNRRIGYVRNSFSPIVFASLEENDKKTIIKLKLRITLPILVFTFLLETIMLLGMFIGAIMCFTGDFNVILSTSLMFSICELLMFLFFKIPAKHMIERLEELLVY